MLYSQPLATRFGTDLISQLECGVWKKLDIAVAWVRASGVKHLEPALSVFLKGGNELTIVVGIDFDNTTTEGLEGLLRLQAYGTASIFVHHNEASTIFHPKLYLFRNDARARLIVGSNNITEAGLFLNTEAGLALEEVIANPIIVSAVNALCAWRDTSLGLAKQLDTPFLAQLVRNGYIKDEASVRAAAAARRAGLRPKQGGRKTLFGYVRVTAPAKAASSAVTLGKASQLSMPPPTIKIGGSAARATSIPATAQTATGQVLLMRVRKARGTQVQIPLAVMRTPFFHGVTQVRSIATNLIRGIRPTHATRAKGSANPNTLKLEMPETQGMIEPLARFERTSVGIQYEVYDHTNPKGQTIMQALQLGRSSTPPSTHLALPSSPANSTWWRFI